MATAHQPLLDKPKNPFPKAFWLLLSFVAILTPSALIASYLIKPYFFFNLSLPHHVCEQALEKETCMAHVSELLVKGSSILTTKDVEFTLLRSFLMESTSHIRKAMHKANTIKQWMNHSPRDQAALSDCDKLLDFSMDRVRDSMMALNKKRTESQHDAHTWLSCVLSYHVTCLEGLEGSARTLMESDLEDLISRAKTSLDMFVAVFPPNDVLIDQPLFNNNNGDFEFPSWVTRKDRRLLESSPKDIKHKVVVAQDGSGNFKTVNEAVASAPDNGKTRYVIFVKKGTYVEQVNIGKTKTNVMLLGEGMDATIITGSLNQKEGQTIMQSGTVACDGNGFIAQNLSIQNTAGPEKHQAVALRLNADRSIINRCSIEGFQDTLFSQCQRQFYRDSIIAGTVDFICGAAAVVFQKCALIARRPMDHQANVVTAQQRDSPNQNSATSIQLCNIKPSHQLEPLIGSIPTFLGRPWGNFSTTVVMESYVGKHVVPAGWSVWSSDSDPMLKTRTLYYGEYQNSGPGSGLRGRVNWTGFHVITNKADALNFTVGQLIHGQEWLRGTGVPFLQGL